ncbi:cadherin repeat domain-containing protein [Fibrobacter sp.]|uniref:cadherin repeat domain-containing protein n=1 Tax=Fibrobacter sp. TaxID=35828 RepID=UPI0038698306
MKTNLLKKVLCGLFYALSVGSHAADVAPLDSNNSLQYLDVDASVLKEKFLENGADALIPIELNAIAKTDVDFKYCFDVKAQSATSEGSASIEDFDVSSLAFPVCDKGEYGQVVIKAGTVEPTDETKIYVNVKKDSVMEGEEILPLKIFDMSGAVLSENMHEGYLNLTIGDDTGASPKFASSVEQYSVPENSATGSIVAKIPIENALATDELIVTLENNSSASGLTGVLDILELSLDNDDGSVYAVLSVKDGSMLDYEAIPSSYNVTLTLKDQNGVAGCNQDTIIRTINVVDVNEIPMAEDVVFEIDENVPMGMVIGAMNVADPDVKHIREFGHLDYSIIGMDESFVFTMDSNKIIVKDPSKMDYESPVHNYTFDVLVKNCEWNKTSGKYDGACLYDTANVVVNIQDVNEKPEIIIDGPTPDGGDDSEPFCVAHCDTTDRGVWKDSILTVGVRENLTNLDGTMDVVSPTGMVLFQYHYADEDTGHVAGAKVTWFDVLPSPNPKLTTKGSDLFNIVGKNGVITVTVKDQKLLDYETLRNATSRNDPDPEYTMGIVVTDPKGLADTLYRIIRVIDENEKPLFTAVPSVVVEGNHPGDSIGYVEHPSDVDSLSRNPAFYDNSFKVTGGDIDRFDLRKDPADLLRISLIAQDSIDCEDGSYICGVDSVYWVELFYGDTTLKTVYSIVRIPVTVADLNEPPVFRTDTIGVAENSPKGTIVDTIKWFDYDRFDTVMHFEMIKDPSGCFAIDENTGIVTVKKDDCTALDYEKSPALNIEVAITDLVDATDRNLIFGGPNTVTKAIVVNVLDVDEPSPIASDSADTVKVDVEEKSEVDEDIENENKDENVIDDYVAPVLTISAIAQKLDSSNSVRITENISADDNRVYINTTAWNTYVSIKDPVKKTDSTYAVSLNFDAVSVPEKICLKLAAIANEKIVLNEPSEDNGKRVLLNNSIVQVSYTEKVAEVDVIVSYKTDADGKIVKQAVVNELGGIDSVKTMTVSYATMINDNDVVVSYMANASTGAMILKDTLGNLLTSSAARGKPNVGYYYVAYDDSANSTTITYAVDKKGSVLKNAEGNVDYEVSYSYVDDLGRSTIVAMNVVVDQTTPVVEIVSPEEYRVFHSNLVNVTWCVNGVLQDSLNVQQLERGPNAIIREFCDKAGNCGVDTVFVVYKGDASGEEDFAEPTFRVVMTGPFQFTIELDWASNLALEKNYAVMDLQGRILQQGVIRSSETVVPVLTSGSYIVKVGHKKRVVNIH